MQKKLLHNQSLFDYSVQHCGNLNGIVALASANGLSITDAVAPGNVLNIPELTKDLEIVAFFENKDIVPATGFKTLEVSNELEYLFAFEFPILL